MFYSVSLLTHCDRRAGDANEGVDVLDDDTEETQLLSNGGIAGRTSGLAALDGSSRARAGWLIGSWCGDSKDSEGGEEGELGEHCEYLVAS